MAGGRLSASAGVGDDGERKRERERDNDEEAEGARKYFISFLVVNGPKGRIGGVSVCVCEREREKTPRLEGAAVVQSAGHGQSGQGWMRQDARKVALQSRSIMWRKTARIGWI